MKPVLAALIITLALLGIALRWGFEGIVFVFGFIFVWGFFTSVIADWFE